MPEAPVHINLEPSTNAPYSKGALEPRNMVGLGGFEPPTSPLSGVRSNQLSYRPRVLIINQQQTIRVGTTQSARSGMGLMFPIQNGLNQGLIVLRR